MVKIRLWWIDKQMQYKEIFFSAHSEVLYVITQKLTHVCTLQFQITQSYSRIWRALSFTDWHIRTICVNQYETQDSKVKKNANQCLQLAVNFFLTPKGKIPFCILRSDREFPKCVLCDWQRWAWGPLADMMCKYNPVCTTHKEKCKSLSCSLSPCCSLEQRFLRHLKYSVLWYQT